MNRYFYNMDVHFKNGRVLKLGVEAVAGLSTREEIQAHVATRIYPTATKILVVPVQARVEADASPTSKRLQRFATLDEKNAEERLRRLKGDLKGLPDSVVPGRRQGSHFTHDEPLPAEIAALLRDDEETAAAVRAASGHPVVPTSMDKLNELFGVRPEDPDVVDSLNPDLVDPGMGENPDPPPEDKPAPASRRAAKPSPPSADPSFGGQSG